eukprot:COSAG06_NODE_2708_length_6408_cov_2.142970_2_plen_87_part_00
MERGQQQIQMDPGPLSLSLSLSLSLYPIVRQAGRAAASRALRSYQLESTVKTDVDGARDICTQLPHCLQSDLLYRLAAAEGARAQL